MYVLLYILSHTFLVHIRYANFIFAQDSLADISMVRARDKKVSLRTFALTLLKRVRRRREDGDACYSLANTLGITSDDYS